MVHSGGLTEDETCRAFVLPALAAAGWRDAQIRPQYQINDGKITAGRRLQTRGERLIADYVLEISPGLPIGVVEAKRTRKSVATGVEQARRYMSRLDLPFAYATNGKEIYEIDRVTGRQQTVPDFPSPDDLWRRYRTRQELDDDLAVSLVQAPFNLELRNTDTTPRRPRYYQQVAVNRTMRAIAADQRRILLVLATGTGKTMVAFQIVSKLREARWPDGRRPRVLYLADRDILASQPENGYFRPVWGDLVQRLGGGAPTSGREIYFALYQAMDYGDTPLYRQYARDYFDVVIVDECHRGSARESSQWRAILEHFEPAVQIGMTATPIRRGETDTYSYFGDPIYEYSLAQGIDDGYLAPYRVRRVRLNVDMTGFRPTPGQRDLYGNEIPDKLYTQAQYERIMVILERTREAARYLTRFLRETDRMGKTIVFCENNDHAHRMREALNNANLDFVREHPNYVVRITDDDGDPGRALLSEFQDPGRDEPVIAVTSRLLSTGVDMPPVRNIVIFRRIGSVSEFKQIVGRGTRLCPDIDKASFDIIDFVDATILFNDPTFDGPPLLIREDTLDEQGDVVDSHKEQPGEVTATEPTPPEIPGPREDKPVDLNASTGGQSGTEVTDRDEQELIQARPPRYVVEGGSQIFVWGESFYQLDSDGRTLRLITYRQFVHDRVLELRLSAEALRTQWATARTRREMIDLLRSKEIEFEELTRQLQQPDVDPIDLLLNAAWGLPLVTRQERVARVRRKDRAFLDAFAPEAQEVLDALLTKFEEHDATVLAPATLRVPPLDRLGSVTDLAARFGGADGLHQALDDLGRRLFDVA